MAKEKKKEGSKPKKPTKFSEFTVQQQLKKKKEKEDFYKTHSINIYFQTA